MHATLPGRTAWETSQYEKDHGLTASIIGQLNDAARLLEAKPHLPLDRYSAIWITHSAGSTAEVDAIAAELGVTAGWTGRSHTHYLAELILGPNVSYRAVYITPLHMAAYEKHMAGFPDAEDATKDTPEAGVQAA